MMYLFAYDVSDNRRRAKIAHTLEKFGLRVQKSFFQLDVPEEKAREVRDLLLGLMDRKEDSLLFYPICSDCLDKVIPLGEGTLLQELRYEIL